LAAPLVRARRAAPTIPRATATILARSLRVHLRGL